METNTNIDIGIAKRCFNTAGLKTTCFGLYIGHHQVVKGKAVPLQAWSGPEGSRKLRFPDYMTTAQDGGKFVSLYHQEMLLVLISVRG
jgi:hypothetical protein